MNPVEADVIVVGAGPAGLAAVRRLLQANQRVIWVDQGARPGGQIWRSAVPQQWEIATHPHLLWLPGHAVIAAEGQQRLLLHSLINPSQASLWISAPRLLLALGARERFLPFPGWTLPGVHGAGGLQALVKNGWPIRSQRTVLAGSGPLLLAAADTVRAAGADLRLIAEQASATTLTRFAARLPQGKIAQAAALRWRLRGAPYRAATWVVRALGEYKLEAVELNDGSHVSCEALGIGFGLLPNTALAELLGCRISAGAIAVDGALQTSLKDVYAAGECTGIGGVDKALIEGELAALQMLGQDDARLRRAHVRAQAFAGRLAASFAPRPALLQLADAKTTICRCENVTLAELKTQADWRSAKLQTRCGMGACQGRICGPITQELLGWPAQQGVREPLQPVPLGCFLPPREPA